MAFSPDQVKARISKILGDIMPNCDVSVQVGPVPYGYWVWDEKDRHHAHLPPGFANWCLGERINLPQENLSWGQILKED